MQKHIFQESELNDEIKFVYKNEIYLLIKTQQTVKEKG